MFGSFVSVVESATYPVAQAISDGVSSLMNDIDDTVIDRIATSNAHAVTLKALKLRSFVTVPLSAGGEIVGALSCALAHEAAPRSKIPRAYDAEDLFFLEELGPSRRSILVERAALRPRAPHRGFAAIRVATEVPPALARYRDRCRLPSGKHRSDDRWRLVRRLRTRRRAHRDHDRRRGRARARGGHRDDEAAPVDASARRS